MYAAGSISIFENGLLCKVYINGLILERIGFPGRDNSNSPSSRV